MTGADPTSKGTIYSLVIEKERALIWSEFHIEEYPSEMESRLIGKENPRKDRFLIRDTKPRATRVLEEQVTRNL